MRDSRAPLAKDFDAYPRARACRGLGGAARSGCDYRGDNKNPAPAASETKTIARQDRDRQDDQRQNADPVRRQKLMKREEEASHARGGRGRQKERSPAVEPFRSEQSVHDDKARTDPQ